MGGSRPAPHSSIWDPFPAGYTQHGLGHGQLAGLGQPHQSWTLPRVRLCLLSRAATRVLGCGGLEEDMPEIKHWKLRERRLAPRARPVIQTHRTGPAVQPMVPWAPPWLGSPTGLLCPLALQLCSRAQWSPLQHHHTPAHGAGPPLLCVTHSLSRGPQPGSQGPTILTSAALWKIASRRSGGWAVVVKASGCVWGCTMRKGHSWASGPPSRSQFLHLCPLRTEPGGSTHRHTHVHMYTHIHAVMSRTVPSQLTHQSPDPQHLRI